MKAAPRNALRRRAIDPRAVELPVLIERGIDLHGHLGPYLVVGIRMGLLALDLLGSAGYFGIEAESETGSTPPLSCLADGLQIGSGCTLGKGNLRIVAGGRPRARFFASDGRSAAITLCPEAERLLSLGDEGEASDRVRTAPIGALFTWTVTPLTARASASDQRHPESPSDRRGRPSCRGPRARPA